jgi:hypothetical protein
MVSDACECASLPGAARTRPSRAAFVARLELIDGDPEEWAELRACPVCGQRWYVEKGAEMDRQENIAFKLPSLGEWRSFDREPALRALLVREHGGEGDSTCVFAGCGAPVLQSLAVCVQHAHSEYRWSGAR